MIYVALLAALRLFGKREVGQFTLFDLVLILLVANAVQPAMTGSDSSLLGGLIIILTLCVINLGVGRLDALPMVHGLFTYEPTVIIKDGVYLKPAMDREGVDQPDAEMAIREHGIADLKDVALGVLEADGSISIVGKDGQSSTKRRVRRRFRPRS
ncbi:MAG TPA: YetF domain-containing protein [Candidatus Dormibacteraeota bacterium]